MGWEGKGLNVPVIYCPAAASVTHINGRGGHLFFPTVSVIAEKSNFLFL